MRAPVLFIFLLSTVVLMGITHFAALEMYLYFKYPWLDIPIHILGGISVALTIFLLPVFNIRFIHRYMTIVPILSAVLIVGLLWEVFEIWVGIPLIEDDFEYDLILDLCMDVVGGFIGYIVGSNVSKL